jgi:hypothetical protein
MSDFSDEIESIVRDALRDSVAAHKRRVGIRQGRVEPSRDGCDHSDWDDRKNWCNGCGVTLDELVMEKEP